MSELETAGTDFEVERPAALPALPFRDRVDAGEEGVQVIAFRLGGELHACDILLVQEVVMKRRVHRLPDMPGHLLGMLRLRGELVPVVDVAPRLGLALESEGAPSILVMEGEGESLVGVAVDAVHEVVTVPASAYRPAPLTGKDRDAYVVGVARVGGSLLTLIDLAEILRDQTTHLGERP